MALPPERRTRFVERSTEAASALRDPLLRLIRLAEALPEDFLERPAISNFKEVALALDSNRTLAARAIVANRYVVIRELGRGGFGVVYLAQDRQLHLKSVVLKIGRRAAGVDPMYFEKRFRLEVISMARVVHPGVVGVLDFGQTEGGDPFLVMQYVPGATLRSVLENEGRLTLRRTASLVRQLGYALTAAHDCGVLHRDLKPENIMLNDPGSGEERAVIIDFGVATMREADWERSQWTRGVGTLAYMAPEQSRGNPSAASDIYALGVVAFEMLAGVRPKRTGNRVRPPLTQIRREVPRAAETAIWKAMSSAVSERPASARQFGEDLANLLNEPAEPERTIFRWIAAALFGICLGFAWIAFMTSPFSAPVVRLQQDTFRGFRIAATATGDSHIYVVEESAGGNFVAVSASWVKSGESMRYPESGAWERVPPGKERIIWIVSSRKEIRPLSVTGARIVPKEWDSLRSTADPTIRFQRETIGEDAH
jgi:serine/threonine protein kinase